MAVFGLMFRLLSCLVGFLLFYFAAFGLMWWVEKDRQRFAGIRRHWVPPLWIQTLINAVLS
jgi:uncharacterized iron-regulated membrane protein